ncbi:S-Ena type endospore appendage [Priestia filamentosa]|uniref:S-Ena type endospore appendage n=1 Tax=Priestia filamentosa TaxID=1402861 RepID=UPI0039782837
MCDSSNGGLAPPAQMFQESLCGNFNNPTAAAVTTTVWTAPAGAYFSGTFEIFNSASSPVATPVTATTSSVPVGALSATSGNSASQSVDQPTDFEITVPPGANGKFGITLYKRVLA